MKLLSLLSLLALVALTHAVGVEDGVRIRKLMRVYVLEHCMWLWYEPHTVDTILAVGLHKKLQRPRLVHICVIQVTQCYRLVLSV